MHHRAAALFLVLASLASTPLWAQEEDPPAEERRDYQRGTLRLGAFAITSIDTTVIARAEGVPLGVYIDLGKDFGLKGSDTVPRLFFHYRFARRHQLDFDWFALDRSSTAITERRIEIGDDVIEAGTEVAIDTDISIYKLLYTWIFHDSGKVTLGASAGLNVLDFDLAIKVDLAIPPASPFDETAGVAAPLPVLGFRLNYAATPKLSLAFTGDILAVDIGDYSGTLQDIYFAVDYRLAKWVGLGGGINSLSLNLKVDDDDVLAELRHGYRGFLGFVSFYF